MESEEESKDESDPKIPDYLAYDKPLISDTPLKTEKVHLIELLMDNGTLEEISKDQCNTLFELYKPMLTAKKVERQGAVFSIGSSLLISLVRENSSESALNYLLGATYDTEKEIFVLNPR